MTDLASKPSSLSFQRTSVSGTEYISANSVAVSEVDSASAEADRAVEVCASLFIFLFRNR